MGSSVAALEQHLPCDARELEVLTETLGEFVAVDGLAVVLGEDGGACVRRGADLVEPDRAGACHSRRELPRPRVVGLVPVENERTTFEVEIPTFEGERLTSAEPFSREEAVEEPVHEGDVDGSEKSTILVGVEVRAGGGHLDTREPAFRQRARGDLAHRVGRDREQPVDRLRDVSAGMVTCPSVQSRLAVRPLGRYASRVANRGVSISVLVGLTVLSTFAGRSVSSAPSPPGSASAAPSFTPIIPKKLLPSPANPAGVCPAGMAFVPGGVFRAASEVQVTPISSFCMDQSEATRGSYRACVASGACAPVPAQTQGCGLGDAKDDLLPMTCIKFAEADRYCVSLGRRLPSGREYEWASRSANAAFRHPWGNAAPEGRACFDQASLCPIALFVSGASLQGIVDLVGNAQEWVTDGTAAAREVRGGTARHTASDMIGSRRSLLEPTSVDRFVGFRCVLQS